MPLQYLQPAPLNHTSNLPFTTAKLSRGVLPRKEMTKLLEIPSYIGPYGRLFWMQIGPKLQENGHLTPLTKPAFEVLCNSYNHLMEANEEIRKHGLFIEKPRGGRKVNPAVKIMQAAQGQVIQLMAEFFITPAAIAHFEAFTE